jgi:hypothetical protein
VKREGEEGRDKGKEQGKVRAISVFILRKISAQSPVISGGWNAIVLDAIRLLAPIAAFFCVRATIR